MKSSLDRKALSLETHFHCSPSLPSNSYRIQNERQAETDVEMSTSKVNSGICNFRETSLSLPTFPFYPVEEEMCTNIAFSKVPFTLLYPFLLVLLWKCKW